MHRIRTRAQASAIGAALDLIPLPIRQRLEGARIVSGVDPVFAGVHTYASTSDGRSYRDTACVLYPCHQLHRPVADRQTTVVLPDATFDRDVLAVIVHEYGHVLDEVLGFSHTAAALTRYARTSRPEAFAEAFTAWLFPGYCEPQPDAATAALFATIS